VRDRVLWLLDEAAEIGGPSAARDVAQARALVAACADEDIFERRILDRRPLSRWSSPERRVVLIGDAAHCMHPLPGQGANTCFEDVACLARVLCDAKRDGALAPPASAGASDRPGNKAAVAESRKAIARHVLAYEQERMPVGHRRQREAREAGLRQQQGASALLSAAPTDGTGSGTAV